MRVRVKERRMGVFARCRRKGYSYGLSRGLRRRGTGPGMYVAGHDIGGCREAARAVGDTTPIPARAGVPGEWTIPTLLTVRGGNTCRPQRDAHRSQRNAHGGSEKAHGPWKLQMGPAFFRGAGYPTLVSSGYLSGRWFLFLFHASRVCAPGSFSCHRGRGRGRQCGTDVAECELCHSFAIRH